MTTETIATRADGRFMRLSQGKVEFMREAKLDGYSLREIAEEFGVAKSTASLYCRDLFYHPNRMYETEEEAREAVRLRGVGQDHSKYHQCVDCGKKIRNEHIRCLRCLLAYQYSTGELNKFISSGEKYRFRGKRGNYDH